MSGGSGAGGRLAPPLVQASAQWRVRSGMLFGTTQPSLHGYLTVRNPAAERLPALEALERAFAALLAEAPRGWPQGSVAVVERVLHWVAALQRSAGLAVASFAPAGPALPLPGERQRLRVAVSHAHPSVAARTLVFVLRQVNSAGHSPHADLAQAFAPLRRLMERTAAPGQNSPLLAQAALALGLPVTPLATYALRLGWGSRQQVFASTFSQRTPALGAMLARDKQATATLLRRVGLPGAVHEVVTSANEAAAAAQRLGWPVVVKPMDLDGGIGVAADLPDESAVRRAYEAARRHSQNILVERHAPGVGHRLTVVDGSVVKVTAKLPWGVTGDGLGCIADLADADIVARAAKRPHETPAEEGPALDEEALGLLRQHGFTPESVPEAGRFVALRRRNNAHAGGSTRRIDIEAVHPHNLQLAARAAEALLLDIAGVDLIVPDIACSWTAQPALICEVNAKPQSDLKTLEAMLRRLVGDTDVRTPVWLLVLPRRASFDAGQAAELARLLGADGWATLNEAHIAGEALAVVQAPPEEAADTRCAAGTAEAAAVHARALAAAVLASRQVHEAMITTTPRALLRHGMPVDRLAGCLLADDAPGLLALARALVADAPPAIHVAATWSRRHEARLRVLRLALEPHLVRG